VAVSDYETVTAQGEPHSKYSHVGLPLWKSVLSSVTGERLEYTSAAVWRLVVLIAFWATIGLLIATH
jgi:hypothetical protein